MKRIRVNHKYVLNEACLFHGESCIFSGGVYLRKGEEMNCVVKRIFHFVLEYVYFTVKHLIIE